jgi:hypothetical protein
MGEAAKGYNMEANTGSSGKKKKAKKENIFSRHPLATAGFIVGLFAAFFLLSGIYGLVKLADPVDLQEFWSEGRHDSGESVSGTAHYGSEVCFSIQHTINLIPTGTEYYYLVFNDDFTECIMVRAGKNWSKPFDHYGYSEDGVALRGCLAELNHDAKKQLTQMQSSLSKQGVTVVGEYYIDNMQPLVSVLSIVMGLLTFFLIWFFARIIKPDQGFRYPQQRNLKTVAFVIVLTVDVVLMIYILNFR